MSIKFTSVGFDEQQNKSGTKCFWEKIILILDWIYIWKCFIRNWKFSLSTQSFLYFYFKIFFLQGFVDDDNDDDNDEDDDDDDYEGDDGIVDEFDFWQF